MTTKNDALKYLDRKLGALTFAKALKAWREGEGMNQARFARKLGISVQSLCDLEKGRRIPSPARASRIAKKLAFAEVAWVQLAVQDALAADGLKMTVRIESA